MSVSLLFIFVFMTIVRSDVGRDSKCDKGVYFIDKTQPVQDKSACIGYDGAHKGTSGFNERLDALLSANPDINWHIDTSGMLHVKPNDKFWLHWNKVGMIGLGCDPNYYCARSFLQAINPFGPPGYPSQQQIGPFDRSACGIGAAFIRAVCDGGHWHSINMWGIKGGWTIECRANEFGPCEADPDAEVGSTFGITTQSRNWFLVLVGVSSTLLLILALVIFYHHRTTSTVEYSLLEDDQL